jgi:DNA-binding transcriptional MerR regulator
MVDVMAAASEMRIDELARRAEVASTTVRMYQQRGLLPGPRLEGRTGYYDETHLARLRLIARLQDEGHSLSGIGQLLASWQQGRELADLVGVEAQLDTLLHGRRAVVLDPAELFATFPLGAISPDQMQEAIDLGLVEPTKDGRFRLPDERFLHVGTELTELGIPAGEILDEWARLVAQTDEIAARFVSLFEVHLLPEQPVSELDAESALRLATALARLHHLAGQVLGAAFDASLSRVGGERLRAVLDAAEADAS